MKTDPDKQEVSIKSNKQQSESPKSLLTLVDLTQHYGDLQVKLGQTWLTAALQNSATKP